MAAAVACDITRLATRVLNLTPNGIDRLDHAYASHFLSSARENSSAMMMTLLGPRIISAAAARDIVNGISIHWGEETNPEADESFLKAVAWIKGEAAPPVLAQRIAQGRPRRLPGLLQWFRVHGIPLGRPPARALPKGACYLNISQFPLWIGRYFAWLEERPDIKAVFFIHDLLPIETPEYFRKAEYERHLRRLNNLARFGTGAIVTTRTVRDSLQRHLAGLGRKDMPILVAPVPVAPVFYQRSNIHPDLAGHPYFVTCGTIEPRKNHLLLLHVWRELVRRDGAAAPKLVLIGSRGWENENAIDLLQRCPLIRGHVLEVTGLSTPSLKRLLDGARALLMPSFAEGYGLPVAEALAAGLPVVASDIPVFRETGGGRFTALSPIDGEGWLETIRGLAGSSPQKRMQAASSGEFDEAAAHEKSYFAKVSSFLASL
ncbi:MAG: glycosyltransferase family 4 protein [Beijerinckiaceae bacterium]|nr:glycosyltransferase family 4 protein [Beijerinckiaceae bacterium]